MQNFTKDEKHFYLKHEREFPEFARIIKAQNTYIFNKAVGGMNNG